MNPIDLLTPAGATLALLPELLLTAGALVVLLVMSWRHRTAGDSLLAGWLSLLSLAVGGAGLAYLWVSGATPAGAPAMIALDGFRYVSGALILLCAAATVLLSLRYLEREQLLAPEFYVLLLLATVGLLLMPGAQDLMVFFLGLETMSVAVYVLAGYDRRSPQSAEAALKYFLIGAFASAFLLYGIALIYGATGTTNLVGIGAKLSTAPLSLMASLGLGFLLIGLGFKVAAVPFHMWTPDVYEGAPTPVTGFMAAAVKAAGFAGLARILVECFPAAGTQWKPIVLVLSIATMVLGNLVALSQRSIKRLLAYSSIAHAGYLLAAIWPGSQLGYSALMLYLMAYGVTTLASFGLLSALGRDGERDVTLDSIAGLGAARPGIAAALSICLFSLLGFPGTLGFIGKWYILTAVLEQHQSVLAVVLVLTSVVSAGYYLPIIMSMYMKPSRVPLAHTEVGLPPVATWVIALSVLAILVLGVIPISVLDLAGQSAQALLGATGRAIAAP